MQNDEKTLKKQSLVQSIAWIGGSQAAVRLARILSTIVVARMIAPELLGVAAIAFVINEISHVLARNATNSRIIRASDQELKTLCDTAYYANWLVGLTIFVLQSLVGYAFSIIYNDSVIFSLVTVLGFTYLLLPIAQVHTALNLRDEKIGLIARTEIQQTVCDAFLTVSMVLLGFGLWALILPKLLVVPVWIRAQRRASTWETPKKFTLLNISDHFAFNSRVLGVELLGVLRHNIDYILIGYFLGMQALGIYYFAFNAGLGITRGFIISLNNAFYPYLCAARDDLKQVSIRFHRGLRFMLLLMVPLLGLQAYMADYYVPILFGDKWTEHHAAQLVSLICLTGIPLLVMEAGTQYMRALGKPANDLVWFSAYTVIFTGVILVGVQWHLIGVVMAILFAQFVAAPLYILFVVKLRSNDSVEFDNGKAKELVV